MPVYSFPCPHCSTPLRLKDRRMIGRTIDCPDCGQAVLLREDSPSGVIGKPASLSDLSKSGRSPLSPAEGAAPAKPRRLANWWSALTSPLGIAWIVAAGLGTGLLCWLVSDQFASTSSPPDVSAEEPRPVLVEDSAPVRLENEAVPHPDAVDNRTNTINEQQAPPDPVEAAPVEPHPVAAVPKRILPANPFDAADIIAELAGGADIPIDIPIDVPLAAEPDAVDVTAALNQPIARFDQSTPVRADVLLRMIEEMATVEIETGDLPEQARSRLERPVRLTVNTTTVGDILTALLEQLDLSFEVRDGKIRLQAAPATN